MFAIVCIKVQKRLCFSMSDYHPAEWDPGNDDLMAGNRLLGLCVETSLPDRRASLSLAWTVSNILIGLLSFMLEETPTYGSIDSTDSAKRQLATLSHRFNAEKTDPWFRQLFPDIWAACRERADAADSVIGGQNRGRPVKIDIAGAENESPDDADAEVADFPREDGCCLHADLILLPIVLFFCLAVIVLLAVAVVLSLF